MTNPKDRSLAERDTYLDGLRDALRLIRLHRSKIKNRAYNVAVDEIEITIGAAIEREQYCILP